MPAVNIQLITGVQTANGNSAPITLATATMGLVGVKVNAAPGGTSPELHAWMQYSPNGGSSWFDISVDAHVFTEDLDEPSAAPTTDVRNVTPATTGLDANGEQASALYRHMPAGLYRFKWRIAGTSSPTFDFTAWLSTK